MRKPSFQTEARGDLKIIEGFLLRRDYREALPWIEKLRALITDGVDCAPGAAQCRMLGDLAVGAKVIVDGYTFDVFMNRDGHVQLRHGERLAVFDYATAVIPYRQAHLGEFWQVVDCQRNSIVDHTRDGGANG